ncbi:MAG: hypothetical protein JST62_00315 [Bacteroidetes bacterium]|nr:hypothetical protein [Bacteroidota bacterium]
MVIIQKRKTLGHILLGIANLLFGLLLLFLIIVYVPGTFYIKLIFSLFPILMVSSGVIILLRLKGENKIIRIISIPFEILLLPIYLVSIFSQSYYYRILVLPQFALGIIIIFSSGFYAVIGLLNISNQFNSYVIPYLNLTTIMVIFSYFDKFLTAKIAKTIPDSQMSQSIKNETINFLSKRPFIKVAYLIMVVLIIIVNIEDMGSLTILNFLDDYKKVVLQSFITFIAIDRCVSKWK